MKKLAILTGAAIAIVLLGAFPIFRTSARRDVITYNTATLRSIAIALQRYSEANNGRLPIALRDLGPNVSPDKIRYRTANGQFYDWIYRPKGTFVEDKVALVVSPVVNYKTKSPTRLVLLSDYTVQQIDERLLGSGPDAKSRLK